MAINRARTALGRVFTQRCFYLFAGVLALMVAALLLEPTPRGRLLVNALNLLIDVAAVAAVGRSTWSFLIATALAVPAMYFQVRGIAESDDMRLVISWTFNAALFAVTIAYLLRYVFQRDVMTSDKLYGAAAAYLMLGVLWALLYAIATYFQPDSFSIGGTVTRPTFTDLLYFSITTLTSTGFGDIVPLLRRVRALCVLEQLTGALFLAILIARLAGVYPPSPPPVPLDPTAPPTPRFIQRLRERSRSGPPR
jgi:ion channel